MKSTQKQFASALSTRRKALISHSLRMLSPAIWHRCPLFLIPLTRFGRRCPTASPIRLFKHEAPRLIDRRSRVHTAAPGQKSRVHPYLNFLKEHIMPVITSDAKHHQPTTAMPCRKATRRILRRQPARPLRPCQCRRKYINLLPALQGQHQKNMPPEDRADVPTSASPMRASRP